MDVISSMPRKIHKTLHHIDQIDEAMGNEGVPENKRKIIITVLKNSSIYDGRNASFCAALRLNQHDTHRWCRLGRIPPKIIPKIVKLANKNGLDITAANLKGE